MQSSGNPLVEALGDGVAAKIVNYVGLAGLIASFFSIIYAYSRQLFELSRAAVAAFLRQTETLVPSGTESALLDLDDELHVLLTNGGSDSTGH